MKQPAVRKLSPQSEWLLLYLKQKHDEGLASPQIGAPLGVSSTAPLPVFTPMPGGKIGMVHMNGLIRRGWAEERHNGIYFLTASGLAAAQTITSNP
jgi:hypothetical protein